MIKNIVFVGTPFFSVPTLQALCNTRYKPVLVITQPDRPKGRKLVLSSPPVKDYALTEQIEVIQPESINDTNTINILKELKPDIIITISYGGFIGKTIRMLPKYGVINIHPSLLPKFRGSTPIQSALLNGDTETGISIFKINAKMDAGDILYQSRQPIDKNINFTKLEKQLSEQAATDMIKLLETIEKTQPYDNLRVKQNDKLATYTEKVSRETLLVNWNNKAQDIVNFIRAYSEEPAAYTFFNNKEIKMITTSLTKNKSEQVPGSVTTINKNKSFHIATKDYDVEVLNVKSPGKKIMLASDFINGSRLKIGDRFTNGL
ncbi:MAG: methionyl-tRNA formyltransferase [Candidatus Cloacimonadales bacterium]|jgi:methionyl-tRNA formyltransferase|nr:methionyl-tRNA formyltransferase [Candidatus Cloacimonadota bacterium]MDD2649888.1 methionyl-tRNA formyltransferase [Candidatus Cloacimonadota bacterium]MDX9977103.1 methionyl-tRNA formyltransferase [Candidatus Cloacimonadales bacterium]